MTRGAQLRERAGACSCGGACPRCAGPGHLSLSGGRPLPAELRARFEAALAADLSRVRVHTESAATTAATALGARAFTLGHDMVFRAGEYRPGTATGDWLLGHELAHVAQLRPGRASDGSAGIESDARRSATAALLGLPAAPQRHHDGTRIHRFGAPEHVPNLTYISTQGSAGYLNQAVAYHNAWGIPSTRVSSLEEVVNHLAGGQGRVGRVRIVAHAAAIGPLLSLFRGQPRASLSAPRLAAWTTSDTAGLSHDLAYPFGRLNSARTTTILTHLRRNHRATLLPFGLQATGSPTGALAELFQRATDLALLNRARTPQNAVHVDPLITATGTILGDIRARVATQGRITAAATLTLQTAVGATGFIPQGFAPSAHQGRTLRAANRAVAGNFRASLARARLRLDANSWIDVRGCNLGSNRANLLALQRLFGRGAVLPHVSAPDWFQLFLQFGYQSLTNDAAIDAAFSRSGFAATLARWSVISGIRGEIQALRLFYAAALLRRQQANLARRALLSAGSPFGPSRRGPFPRLNLGIGPLIAPVIPLPTIPRTSSPADQALIQMIMSAELGSLNLNVPSLTAPRFPLALNSTLRDPLEALIREALRLLNLRTGEARYYFHSPHVLPALRGAGFRFYYLRSLRELAFDRWLDSQWTTAPPNLRAIKRQAATRADSRRIQALTPQGRGRLSRMLFPPDPAYWAHIIRI